MHIGERIKQARQLAGLQQEELARRLNLKPQSVNQWERGATSPRPYRYAQLVAALDQVVTLEWLATGQGDPQRASEKTPYPYRHSIVDSFLHAGAMPVLRWEVETWTREGPETYVDLPSCGGVKTFALRITPDMRELLSEEFAGAEFVYIDPEASSLPGDYVLVRHEELPIALLARLVAVDDQHYVTPLGASGRRKTLLALQPPVSILGRVILKLTRY